MVENIHLAQSRKRTAPRCTMKVDIQKAYNTISWEFMEKALRAFGFPNKFVMWIMECVTAPSYSLKVNGETFGFFKGRRGIRQGDPISPFLYVIGTEYLSRSLN